MSRARRNSESTHSRRSFLQSALVTGAASALYPALGAARAGASSASEGSACPEPNPGVKPFELDEITIAELQEGMKSGRFTARSLVEKYTARMEEIDKHGPAINSIIELNPDALTIADGLDEERKAKGSRGPLHGIPVLIKDNIDTADRMMTTAGSLALAGSKPPKDSFLAQRLRAAGAVILAKTNLSEWANIRSNHSTSGWSGRGGQTKNPYALDRNPCGSSSGTGAGISANLAAAGIGTETDGSIVCPSSANGLAGIKPTVGLVSRSGIIPISHSQDGAGPMCRTVRDAAILLGALTGLDPEDSATAASAGKSQTDYAQFCDPNGLKGACIGVARKYFGFNDAVDALMEQALDVMKKQGATLVDPADIETHGKFGESEFLVLLYELKADLNAYLARLGPGAPVRTLKDIIEFNERNWQKEMPYFGQDVFLKAEGKGPLTEKEYVDALATNHQLARSEGIDALMDKHKLDAIVAPTGGPAWLTDLLNGDHDSGGSSNAAAVAGYPNINVTAGFISGLPVGISFFGRAWSEPTLIRLAYSFEQATKARQAPRFLASVG
ncbi:Amidase [Candidatus Sulfotelmatobacter kueseliae]|uniref:Amidase n=1 Tax=Candidatus Sulfotelmatobacter kueseliae TaxID=2042962 RepID=A0A2U3K1W7_9BACT|nr:Amidase [Candidatus Sulfotelmatobacter kueseliae]